MQIISDNYAPVDRPLTMRLIIRLHIKCLSVLKDTRLLFLGLKSLAVTLNPEERWNKLLDAVTLRPRRVLAEKKKSINLLHPSLTVF